MKTTGVCLCDSPLRFEHGYCGRCWNRQFATDAGAGRPTTPAPAASSPWDTDADDYTEAFGNTDGLRIRAAFEKRTGRP
jgi:hypothetical protein